MAIDLITQKEAENKYCPLLSAKCIDLAKTHCLGQDCMLWHKENPDSKKVTPYDSEKRGYCGLGGLV